ncbi:MAG: polymerase subunit sigma-54 [Rhizobacter sp.]|nr:polymerase subunit sigma-54 [Rhizobacter sp.]
MTTAFALHQANHQTISPRLQQAVRLLQLSSTEFAQEIQQAMGVNPFLEEDATIDESARGADLHGEGGTLDGGAAASDGGVDSNDSEASDRWLSDHWTSEASAPREGASGHSGDEDFDPCTLIEAQVTLRHHLHTQLNVLHLDRRQASIAGTLVEAIDNDGYLRLCLDELAPLMGLEKPPHEQEMLEMLAVVQSLDPPGVGARNLRECLLLQMEEIGNEFLRKHARTMVSDHLDGMAKQDVHGLAKLLRTRAAIIEQVFKEIRRLDPRPGLRFGSNVTAYVMPDVVVEKREGEWQALLNPQAMPKVRLNQMYAQLFHRHRDSGHSPMAAYLQEARWTLRNIEQRFSTILNVSNAIVRRQKQFFDHGPFAMKPLRLAEIADEMGVHESTVSRATNNKFMATPSGVFELKYFFSRAIVTGTRGVFSATAIREVIRELIQAEDRAHPLSDAEITRKLSRQGLTLARRTVTKYRQQLRTPSYEMRGVGGYSSPAPCKQ